MSSSPFARSAVLAAGVSITVLALTGAGSAQERAVTLDTLSVEGSGAGNGTGVGNGRRAPETARGPVDGYVATRSATATKTDTPIIRTPQSISVVGADQIRAQGSQTLSEAVRYTPGIYANQFGPDTRLDWFLIRGFSATESGLFRDGLQLFQTSFANFRIDPFGAERIELLRGPAATLFGGSPVGGLINIVSKRPTLEPLRYLELGGGSFDQRYAAFDLGGPVDDSGHWFYRLTGRFQNGDAQVNFAPEDRYYIAPSFTYKPDGATTFTVLTSFQRDETGGAGQFLPYSGTVRNNASGFRIDRKLNASDPLVDRYTRNQANLGYEFEHHVDDVWTVRQNFRFSFTEVSDSRYVANGYNNATQTELARYGFLTTPRAGIFTVDNQAEARFNDGYFGHTLLMGVDYKRYSLSDNQGVTPFMTPPPGLNVLFPRYYQSAAATVPYRVINQQLQQVGLYAQDQIALTERLTFLIGGRQDFVTNNVDDKLLPNNSTKINEGAFTGRLGLIYNFDNGLAPYVTYGTSFNPTAGVLAGNVPAKSEKGEQIEVGAKFQPAGWNTLFTLAAFDLVRDNVLTATAENPFVNVQVGKVRSRGFEASAVATLAEGLNLVASYTIYGLRTIEGAGPTDPRIGFVPVGIPENLASLWADYTIPVGDFKGFGFGGGVNYVGRSFADIPNTLTVPEYVTFDASVHYDYAGWRAAVNVINIGDRRFVSSCSSEFACFYGTQRKVVASVSYKW
ncbi:TonB-dependent siderophore receptor [Methylobacterium sp. Leaf93]|uniref:TonB-dependent siderophore receptor n=1 Tax=Methylobacterium sp. Leaf93 TaxID=1736249 RepID=UPI000700CE3A|nr:TonB-dependent siderophore receptor [Methylobacterium sp. Leaf93]KQP16427.1 TonB-dependent receptor [Methylobacterium sp. Leaf93]